MTLLLSLEFLFGVSFGLLFTELRTNSFLHFSTICYETVFYMRPSKPKYENNLCNSNKFIKSQQIVKSVENGPACNGNNKNSNKNCIVLFRGGAWAKIMIIPIGQLLPA